MTSLLPLLYLPAAHDRAAGLAVRLAGQLQAVPDFSRASLKRLLPPGSVALLVGEDLALQAFEQPLPRPVRVDWTDASLLWRLQHGGGRGELLARACGVRGEALPTIIDATAGFGRDSLLLAWLGCEVTMLERSPLVAALLEDGLARASASELLAPALARIRFIPDSAFAYLATLSGDARPDVVYLDPMFPEREKSAKVKANMQVFHRVVGPDEDADALLAPALAVARRRVVVKRPRHAPALAGQSPELAFEGESSRFDVYLRPG